MNKPDKINEQIATELLEYQIEIYIDPADELSPVIYRLPDGTTKHSSECNFTHSLDACGVVVEKLIGMGHLHINYEHYLPPARFVICTILITHDNYIDGVESWDAKGPTMPAAFCNAVLKIIEGEDDGKL